MIMRLFPVVIAMLTFLGGHAMFIQVNTVIPETCGNSNGRVDVQVGGGVEPYSFSWSNGATSEDLMDVPGGTYTLTVTDDLGAQASEQVTVQSYGFLPYQEGGQYYPLPDGMGGMIWGGACAGQCNGQMAMPLELFGGTPPFTIDWNASSNISWVGMTQDLMPIYGGFCLGETVSYTYSDALGCTGSGSHTIIGVDSVPSIAAVHGACAGGANGRVDIYCQQMPWVPPTMRIFRNGNQVAAPTYPWNAPQTIQVQGLLAGDYELRMDWYGACPAVVPFTVPVLTVPCGTVSGTNFLDDDQDCQPGAGEIRMPYQVLNIQPVDEWVLTGGNGEFLFALPNGNYTLEHTAPGIVPLCPLPQPIPFAVNSNASVIQLADSSTLPLDIALYAGGGVARPGFTTTHQLTVRNLSAKLSGAVQVVLNHDPGLNYLSASPTPTSVAGSTLTWDLPQLTAFAQLGIWVQYDVPVATALGTVLASSITAACALADNDLSNNAIGITQVVTGSYDPNDKTARTSSGWSDALYYLDQDEWIDYTIRFQNTGTDTAFTVVITDTLAAEFDMASFQQGTASHAFDVAFMPGRVVEWTFTDILLPDSNVNEAASHGLVSFRIRPLQPLSPGIVIENIANIYFDFNPPVITEPSVLVAEFSTEVQEQTQEQERLCVLPNPVSDHLRISADGTIDAITILSADGREVMRHSPRSTNASVEVSGLRSGAYFISATLHNASFVRARFIKQ